MAAKKLKVYKKTALEKQADAIEQAIEELKEHLLDKNEMLEGALFKDTSYRGTMIYAEDALSHQIVQGIHKLQNESSAYDEEDLSERDLAATLLLKRALAILTEDEAEEDSFDEPEED